MPAGMVGMPSPPAGIFQWAGEGVNNRWHFCCCLGSYIYTFNHTTTNYFMALPQINIQGLNKVDLLRALWNEVMPASFFVSNPQKIPEFDSNVAETIVQHYIDYFCGRAIKCDISKNVANPTGYDRGTAPGTFQRIATDLRSNVGIPTRQIQLKCPCSSGNVFVPFGSAMLPGKPSSVVCANCGHWQSQHVF